MIAYPLALTSFTATQCKRISVILEDAILPTLRISRKMKKVIVHAPLELGGIGLPSIQCLQDQKGIQHLVRQLEWGREPAENVRITLSQLQLQAGFLDPLLFCPTLPAPHIESGWLSHIRQRLCDLNAHVEIEDPWTPLPQRATTSPSWRSSADCASKKGLATANSAKLTGSASGCA